MNQQGRKGSAGATPDRDHSLLLNSSEDLDSSMEDVDLGDSAAFENCREWDDPEESEVLGSIRSAIRKVFLVQLCCGNTGGVWYLPLLCDTVHTLAATGTY